MKARRAVAIAVVVARAAGSSNEQAAEKGVAADPRDGLAVIRTRSASVGAWQERKAATEERGHSCAGVASGC
jgi:hypothetical protein